MNRKFIIDKEINLNNYDYLGTKVYSDNLKKIIENTKENKTFTIGLFGSWGTGKSIMSPKIRTAS
jgi:predicted KAP-like P-loop ATPase